jgi:hypothetical protein
MKKIVMSSIVLMVFSMSMILFQFSCTKEATAQTTTLTKDQILTAKTWKVDKLHHVISGQYSSYTNGGANTTGINYNNLRFTFNSNGTGIYVDQAGASNNLTWQFTSTDKRSLQITAAGRTDTWDMLEIADNYLHASVNLNLNGNTNNIETFRLIQIP